MFCPSKIRNNLMHTIGQQTKTILKKTWRSITLLNVLYELKSCCIRFRIKPPLNYIISDTQTGFLKGKYTRGTTRFTFSGLLVIVIFEKAYDSMPLSFIYKMLHCCFFLLKKPRFYWLGKDSKQWFEEINITMWHSFTTVLDPKRT